MFFVVDRVDPDDGTTQVSANMAVEYTKVKGEMAIEHPGLPQIECIEWPVNSMPQVQIMYNPKKIKSGTRLTCNVDKELI